MGTYGVHNLAGSLAVALVAPQHVVQTGTTPTFGAVAASDTFVPRKGMWYHVKNGGGSTDNVVLNSRVNSNWGSDVDVTVAVAAGAEALIPVGEYPHRFEDPTTGLCTVTHSFTTSVTAGLFYQ